MTSLYEQFIRECVAEEFPRYRPRISVARRIHLLDPKLMEQVLSLGAWQGPRELLCRLIAQNQSSIEIPREFQLNPRVDHAKSTSLELADEHYSSLPPNSNGGVEFRFSQTVTEEATGVTLFVGLFNAGFLWGGTYLCIHTREEPERLLRCPLSRS